MPDPPRRTPPAADPDATTAPPDRPAIPSFIGRYRIRRVLGAGAMGTVYLAHDPKLDRLVALKVPQFEGGPRPLLVERFVREARATATLSHPNICPVYDAGEADGVPYLTMAYVEGKPLADFVQAGQPLPERAVATVVRQLALAMQHAHDHGVVHRDLKPANVMVTPGRKPVVMDFGLARRALASGDETRLTQTGALMGTPAYMSPEQVGGDPAAVGPASDQYSLGVILYELLAGRRPFQGAIGALLGQIAMDAPPSPAQFRPGLDRGLQAICLTAMAKRPDDRYSSMGAFAVALGDWLRGSGPVMVMPEPAERSPASVFAEMAAVAERPREPTSPTRRRPGPLVWAVGGGVAVGLVAVGVWMSRGPAKASRPADQAGSVVPPVASNSLPKPTKKDRPAPPTDDPPGELPVPAKSQPIQESPAPTSDEPKAKPAEPAPEPVFPSRLPVPSRDDLIAAEKVIRTAYRSDLDRRDRAAHVDLAVRLTRAAAAEGSAAVRFALLRVAADVAAQAAATREALAAADELARVFDVEPIAERVKTLTTVAQAMATPEVKKALAAEGIKPVQDLADTAFGVADDAVEVELYDQAVIALRLVEVAARRIKNISQQNRARTELVVVEDLARDYKKVLAARNALLTTPNDAAASFVVGHYRAATRGQWNDALPLLIKAEDAGWRVAAAADLANPATGAAQADAGDRWRTLAAAQAEPAKSALRRRAAAWYERAADGLTRPDEQPRRTVVLQRLKEIDAPPERDRTAPTFDVVYDRPEKAEPGQNKNKETGQVETEWGFAAGRHFVAGAAGITWYWDYADRPADFVVRVVGRGIGPRATSWELAPATGAKTYLSLKFDGDGSLHLTMSDDLLTARVKPEVIRHKAIRSHNRFNTVVVAGRGPRIDLFVNGERMRDTILLPRPIGAGVVRLGINAGPEGGRIEFARLTVWK